MKYIKSRVEFIKEAFESLNISKTISFLKSNVSKDTGRFLEELKKITEIYDYPLSNVKDENIKYMAKWPALNLKPKSEILNEWGVDCLKYWFSLEEGYLGFTAIGNKTFEYREKISNAGTSFTDDELSYLKRNISEQYLPSGTDYTRGIFVPVGISKSPTYEELKTGDVVVGYFNSYEDTDWLTWAVIYVDGDKIYAIQNVADGSIPDNDEWRQYGRDSWVIYINGSAENDHIKLHKYIPSSTVLSIDNDKSENPLDYNLPLRGGNIRSWSENYNSIRDEKQIDKADFCLVMYLDDMMINSGNSYEKPSQMRKSREESRQGATSLLSDEDIKNTNISRYLSQMVGRLGISPETTELKDLNKLVLKFFSGRYALIRLIKKQFSRLEKINDHLYDMVKQSDLDQKKYHYDIILNYYERTINYMTQSSNEYRETENAMIEFIKEDIEEPERTMLLEQWNKCVKLSELITSLIQKQNITTIEDLRILTHKLDSLANLLLNDRSIRLESRFLSILKDFDDYYEIERLADRISQEELKNNEAQFVKVESAIKSILK